MFWLIFAYISLPLMTAILAHAVWLCMDQVDWNILLTLSR